MDNGNEYETAVMCNQATSHCQACLFSVILPVLLASFYSGINLTLTLDTSSEKETLPWNGVARLIIPLFREMAMMNGAVMGKQAQQPPPPAKPGGIEDLAQVTKPRFP